MNAQTGFQRRLYKYYLASSVYFSKVIPFKKRKNLKKIYCVGLSRSGTHSIANMLMTNFKSAHEPFEAQNLEYIIKYRKNEMSDKDVLDFLKIRDYWTNLEVEVAHYLYILVPFLVKLFPNSKFILTVREPLAWVKSEMKKNLNMRNGIWAKYQYLKYSTFHTAEDLLSQDKNLFPLSSYFRYYNHHIKYVMDHVPKENLLILDTYDISTSQDRISSFVGLSPESLNSVTFNSGKGKKRQSVERIINDIPEEVIINEIKKESLDFIKSYVPFLLKRMDYISKSDLEK